QARAVLGHVGVAGAARPMTLGVDRVDQRHAAYGPVPDLMAQVAADLPLPVVQVRDAEVQRHDLPFTVELVDADLPGAVGELLDGDRVGVPVGRLGRGGLRGAGRGPRGAGRPGVVVGLLLRRGGLALLAAPGHDSFDPSASGEREGEGRRSGDGCDPRSHGVYPSFPAAPVTAPGPARLDAAVPGARGATRSEMTFRM